MTVYEEVKGRPQHEAAHETTGIVTDRIDENFEKFEAALWALTVSVCAITVLSFVASCWSVLAGGSVNLAAQAVAVVAAFTTAVWIAPRRKGGDS